MIEDPTTLIKWLEAGLSPILIAYLLWERYTDRRYYHNETCRTIEGLQELIKEDIKITEKLIINLKERLRH